MILINPTARVIAQAEKSQIAKLIKAFEHKYGIPESNGVEVGWELSDFEEADFLFKFAKFKLIKLKKGN